MPIVTYAQNFEDVMLYRALKHVSQGFFIDVGAHHHEQDSVSMLFSKIGWTGIHVEPIANLADALKANRPQDLVLPVAVGTGDGSLILYEIGGGNGLTTGDRDVAERHARNGFEVRETHVEKRTLADILNKNAPEEVHWLKIDVEGMEGDVLKSWSGSSKRPWIVLLESTEPASPEPNHQEWEPEILALGYKFVYFDGLNRFYVSREHEELERFFSCGPNLFDDIVAHPGHWIARGMVSASSAERKARKKGIARIIQEVRIFTRPVRYWIKSGFKQERGDTHKQGFSPVPGMSVEFFRTVKDDAERVPPFEHKSSKP